MIVFCLLLVASVASASPCGRLKSRLDAWVGVKVNALVRAAHAAYESDDALPTYEIVLDGIAGTIRQCKLSEDESFISRHREFVEYIEAASLDKQPDHELGFTVPDKQYFTETSQYVQIPEFLLTQRFIRDVSRYETLGRAKSFLRQLNSSRDPSDQLIFFSYKSRHLGTPDNDDSYRRLLIVVPGNKESGVPDKWVQFGVTDPRARVRVRNVSVVSAVVASDGTFNTYFKDYYRTYRRDGSISIKGRWELGYGDDNCAQCHKSGILPIFPVDGSVSPGEQQAVQAVNQRFLTYGSPRFENYLDERKFGPGLASANWVDRGQRFGEGFGGTVVAHAMSCAACHQPERLGSLNWPMDRTIVSSFIEGGQMPLGLKLQKSERSELYAKLIQEYFSTDNAHPGILKSWLLGTPH
jgi:mono/diheme cytochrome c family protein